MKKSFCFTALILSSFILFSSCWISPDYKDYEVEDNVYFFNDYETMKAIIIPKINASFSAWHWSSDTFDEKYEQYQGNINRNSTDLFKMNSTSYTFAVRNEKSNNKLKTKDGKTISSEYFWITSKYRESVIFYQN